MKKFSRTFLTFILIISILIVPLSLSASAANGKITTPPTGYKNANDVEYVTSNGHLANWGARNEDCVFLSKYAIDYYVGEYSYGVISAKDGGTSQNDSYKSPLYKELQKMMTTKHKHITDYGETRFLYRYTDCVSNDFKNISSFYSGVMFEGTWDSGKTWNREHTWPNSKGINTNKTKDTADIMMLRPTLISENSERGNDAYGEGSYCYDPGLSTRGDCARVVLYTYVRWGNTANMWGSDGVMESLPILLKWMEEDPVDTWEMGRNDAVEQITGVRNVFVDYPEYAWLLFGEEIPYGMSTPSQIAKTIETTTVQGTTINPVSTTNASDPSTTSKTESKKSGCNSNIMSGSIVYISMLYGCAVALKKRK